MKFIAGIVIGVLLSLVVFFGGVYFLFKGQLPATQNNNIAQTAQKYNAAQNAFEAPQIPQTPTDMLVALDKMIAANPSDYNALLTKAALLSQLGENNEAIKFYDRAIAVNPADPAAYYSRALASFALGNLDAANEDLSTALTLNPKMAQAYYNRGVTNLNLARLNNAALDFNKAAQLFYGKDKQAYEQSAQAANTVKVYARNVAAAKRGNKQAAAALKKQNPKELVAVKRDDSILNRNKSDLIAGLKSSGSPSGLTEKFKAMAAGAGNAMGYNESSFSTLQDSVNKAMKETGEKQQNMPKNVLDYRADAQKNMATGNYKGAVADIDKALQKTPSDGSLYYERAKANMAQNNTSEAIKDLSKAIEINPNDASAYYNRANQKSLLGDNKGAIADAQKAQEIFEKQNNAAGQEQAENLSNMLQGKTVKTTKADTEAQRLLAEGSNAYTKGDYKNAVVKFDELIKRQPNIPELYYNRAIANAANGDDAAALKDYNSAIARNPNLPDAHVGAASILLKQGKEQDAMGHINKSIELNPDNPNAYLMRAANSAQQIQENQTPQVQEQHKNKAVEDYNKVLELDPQNASAYFYRGLLNSNKEDLGKAEDLAKQQNNTQLLQTLAQYKQAMQQMPQTGQ